MSRRLDRIARGGHALITGGSSGIGLGTARELRERGCNLSLVGRSEERLASAREALMGAGPDGPEVDLYPCGRSPLPAAAGPGNPSRNPGEFGRGLDPRSLS